MRVIDVISDIIAERKRRHIEPAYALYIDVLNACAKYGIDKETTNRELRKLLNNGVIKAGKTLNDNYIIVI